MKSRPKTDFDKQASSWDHNPMRLKLVNDIARRVSSEIHLQPSMDVLDYGCGTGLLALHLKPMVRSLTGLDRSEGMLEVFKEKIARQGLTGVVIRSLDLDEGDHLQDLYHLIVTSMTMHHIQNIEPLLNKFYNSLLPGGHLCIADLDREPGNFHESQEGIFHFGFDRKIFRSWMEGAGFKAIRDGTAAEVVKTGNDGEQRTFSVFLMIGRKS